MYSTYAAQSPEEVSVSIFIDSQDFSSWRHNLHLEDLVCCKSKSGSKDGVTAARDVTTDTDGFATASDDGVVVFVGCRVNVVHFGTAPNSDGVASNRFS